MSGKPSDREAYNALAHLNGIITKRKRNHQPITRLDEAMWESIKVLRRYGATEELYAIYTEFVGLGYPREFRESCRQTQQNLTCAADSVPAMSDNLTIDGLQAVYQALEELERKETIWYIVTNHASTEIVDDDGNETPGYYAINDCGYQTVIVHPDKLDEFLAAMENAGRSVREVDRTESERRARIRFESMMKKRLEPFMGPIQFKGIMHWGRW